MRISTGNVISYRNHAMAVIVLLFVALLVPVGRDWQTYNVTGIAQMQAPYEIPDFAGMPFAFFALPHALLDIDIGNAINLVLNIVVIVLVARKYAGKQWHIAVAITMTTPFFINLIQSNNIDWIPLAAFLVPDWAAYPLLATKPQMLGMSAVIRFKRNPQLKALIPLIVMLIVSVLIWGAWWTHLGNGLTGVVWNFAPFPFFIPIGIYILWLSWQRNCIIIAACATLFLAPYFAVYSIVGLHVLLACRYRKAALWIWVASWWFFIIIVRWIGA